jgi:hypothetical protein
METQQTKTKIISGDKFSVFVRNANNNQHRTSRGSHKSGEYFIVEVLLEGSHDGFIVPTELSEIKEDSCKFSGWMSVDGHRINVSGQYDRNFENSFVEYVGDAD